MNSSPRQVLENGANILQPFLAQNGFTFRFVHQGMGSGGAYAIGEFRQGNRRLELHFRYSLGLVRYRIGSVNASHEFYVATLGVKEQCHYPGFSDDPLDGFRYLLRDLESFADDFIAGSGAILAQAAESEAQVMAKQQQEKSAEYVGDTHRRAEMRELFRQGRYDDVIRIFKMFKDPNVLTDAERKMVELAQKKRPL